jgi:hypothetical protein
MKNEYKNILISPWFRSALLLVIVYFGQVYPSYHLHHSHEEGSWGVEISSHPIEVDVERSSDHHHDGATPHTNDHQHTYDKHIDWHFIRTQNPRTLTINDQCFFFSIASVFTKNDNIPCIAYEGFICIDGNCVPSSIIRGPPLFG